MTFQLDVVLPVDRRMLGMATLRSAGINLQSAVCLGLADNAAAVAHNNASHDTVLPYGDTPLGVYNGVVIPASITDPAGYGPNKRILLVPVSGDAETAEKNGREGLMCHGGDLNPEYTQWQGLRPTFGCLRFKNEDMATLIGFVDQTGIELVVTIIPSATVIS